MSLDKDSHNPPSNGHTHQNPQSLPLLLRHKESDGLGSSALGGLTTPTAQPNMPLQVHPPVQLPAANTSSHPSSYPLTPVDSEMGPPRPPSVSTEEESAGGSGQSENNRSRIAETEHIVEYSPNSRYGKVPIFGLNWF
jgi:hypothetical protein